MQSRVEQPDDDGFRSFQPIIENVREGLQNHSMVEIEHEPARDKTIFHVLFRAIKSCLESLPVLAENAA